MDSNVKSKTKDSKSFSFELSEKAHSNLLAQQIKFERKTGGTINLKRLVNRLLETASL